MSKKNIGGIISVLIILVGFFIQKYDQDNRVRTEDDSLSVTLMKCIDGDTAWFYADGKEIKVRFLFIDTPESTTEKEEYGEEAAEFTCNKLNAANQIYLEYDGEQIDKYGRTLAWIWIDDILLQEEIAANGYVEKFYDYGNYKYEDRVRNAQTDPYFIYEND